MRIIQPCVPWDNKLLLISISPGISIFIARVQLHWNFFLLPMTSDNGKLYESLLYNHFLRTSSSGYITDDLDLRCIERCGIPCAQRFSPVMVYLVVQYNLTCEKQRECVHVIEHVFIMFFTQAVMHEICCQASSIDN